MKTAIICRQRGIVPVSNSNQSLSVNYSKDAALFAIQRHHRLKKEDFSVNIRNINSDFPKKI